MNRWKIWAGAVAGLLALPYVLLMTAGGLWLYEHGWLLPFLIGTGIIMTLGSLIVRRFQSRRPLKRVAGTEGSANWPPAGDAAWKEVLEIADHAQHELLPLDNPEPWLHVLREVFTAVARHFHPRSKRPELEVPVTDAAHIVELVARDLRQLLNERVPGSHMVTIKNIKHFPKYRLMWDQLQLGYRVVSFGWNPVAAIIREVRDAANRQVFMDSWDEMQRWATGFCVRRAGFYAIQLYSGHLALEDEKFHRYITSQSRDDARSADATHEDLSAEALRFMVIGQTNAGKSSLINALFGEVRAATDAIPHTRGIHPYVLERPGLPKTIILDTAGYAVPDDNNVAALNEALLQTDLVLLVCSAQNAAREPDRALLEELRVRFETDRRRSMPPILVALTHIDLLRPFNDWTPPYNVADPDTPKAKSIAGAVRAVAEDLRIEAERVIPVCLLPERLYNVQAALMPAMLHALPSAQRAKLLRALREFHDEEYWDRLWQQAAGAGRMLAEAGSKWVGSRAEEIIRKFSRQE